MLLDRLQDCEELDTVDTVPRVLTNTMPVNINLGLVLLSLAQPTRNMFKIVRLSLCSVGKNWFKLLKLSSSKAQYSIKTKFVEPFLTLVKIEFVNFVFNFVCVMRFCISLDLSSSLTVIQ